MEFRVVIKAEGEVRDADGNLLSSSPVEAELTLSEQEVKALFEGEE